jgi:Rps23 Pro-64 3,4-dihydroxylase Tpa1-like proline 4-hydroxylase
MLSNDIDFDPYRRQLALRTRVQIPGFLQVPAAERLRDCLQHEVPWSLAERSSGTSRTIPPDEYAAMPPEQLQPLLAAGYARAVNEFQFAYDSYMLLAAAREGRDRGLLLHAVFEFLNSPDFLGFARWLTGVPDIVAANAQATRYRRGHYLTRHEDEHAKENRAYAYVINLTPRWDADWGGLLQFHDANGAVEETFLPRWNALSIFRVPQAHSVSFVTPFAGEDRIAITGWFMRRPPDAAGGDAY